MTELLSAVGSAFVITFVAELGDKTQLIALGLGARHRLAWVITGLALGYAAAGLVAVAVGGVLGAALPERPVAVAGGLVFLVFAFVTWRSADRPADTDDPAPAAGRATVWTVAVAIAVAELGDKTQIATATLAARANPIAVWIGATLGMVASGSVGALAGRRIGRRVDARLVQRGAAVLFAVFGVVLLAGAAA